MSFLRLSPASASNPTFLGCKFPPERPMYMKGGGHLLLFQSTLTQFCNLHQQAARVDPTQGLSSRPKLASFHCSQAVLRQSWISWFLVLETSPSSSQSQVLLLRQEELCPSSAALAAAASLTFPPPTPPKDNCHSCDRVLWNMDVLRNDEEDRGLHKRATANAEEQRHPLPCFNLL
jgi:hypothetical protein